MLADTPGLMNKTASRWLGCAFIALSVLGGGLQRSEAALIIRASEVNGMNGINTLFEWGPGSANYGNTFDVSSRTDSVDDNTSTFRWAAAHSEAKGYDSILSIDTFAKSIWTSGLSGVDFFTPGSYTLYDNGSPTGSEFGIQKLGDNSEGQIFYDLSDLDGNILTVGDGSILFSNTSFSDLNMVDLSSGPVTIFSTGSGNNIVLQLAAVPEPTTYIFCLLGFVATAFLRRRRVKD